MGGPRGCSSAGRAPRSQRGSRRFESAHLHPGNPVKPQVRGYFRIDRCYPLLTPFAPCFPLGVARVWHGAGGASPGGSSGGSSSSPPGGVWPGSSELLRLIAVAMELLSVGTVGADSAASGVASTACDDCNANATGNDNKPPASPPLTPRSPRLDRRLTRAQRVPAWSLCHPRPRETRVVTTFIE